MAELKKIASFEVDHTRLLPGLYVSRYDKIGTKTVTTLDLRFVKPNSGEEISTGGMHTLEHLFATLMRNDEEFGDKVIYVGPMGCRTGMYVVLAGYWTSEDVFGWVTDICLEIAEWEDSIPGATEKECGNASDHDLETAKDYVIYYYAELMEEQRLFYSDSSGLLPRETFWDDSCPK